MTRSNPEDNAPVGGTDSPLVTPAEYQQAGGAHPGARTGGDSIENIENQAAEAKSVPWGVRTEMPVDLSKMR